MVRVKSYELGLLGEVARLGIAMRRWYFSRAAEVILTTLRMFLWVCGLTSKLSAVFLVSIQTIKVKMVLERRTYMSHRSTTARGLCCTPMLGELRTMKGLEVTDPTAEVRPCAH